MRLLLDTHVLIWWWAGDRKLSRAATAAIRGPRNTVHVSAVSGYEITLKQQRGILPRGVPADIGRAIGDEGFTVLPLTLDHAIAAGELPDIHRDPFDRLLIAQARLEALAIVSSDEAFAEYGLRVVW